MFHFASKMCNILWPHSSAYNEAGRCNTKMSPRAQNSNLTGIYDKTGIMEAILTNNALVSSGQSLPAGAAVGVVPWATHIWSGKDAASELMTQYTVQIAPKSSPSDSWRPKLPPLRAQRRIPQNSIDVSEDWTRPLPWYWNMFMHILPTEPTYDTHCRCHE